MPRKPTRRGFGHTRKLPSGRWQAYYDDPQGATRLSRSGTAAAVRHTAPSTYDTAEDAQAWLTDERRLVSSGLWTSPAHRAADRIAKPLLFGEYAPAWLAGRKIKGRPLADRTRDHYQDLLDAHILPTFAAVPMVTITPEAVEHWYELCAVGRPTTQAHAYSLLRTILGSAVDRGIVKTANPARIRGGGQSQKAVKFTQPTMEDLTTVVNAMPAGQQLMVVLAAWCALRFGELAELRRNDIDTKKGIIRVRRGVVRSRSAGTVIKKPKSDAGIRDVYIPPHILPAVRQHLLGHCAPGTTGLLFPGRDGGHLAPSSFYGKAATLAKDGTVKTTGWGWYEARRQADRSDLRFHDLRHLGAVLAAQTGATLAELMGRLGHATPQAAMRYQHAAAERDAEIARKLSELAAAVDV